MFTRLILVEKKGGIFRVKPAQTHSQITRHWEKPRRTFGETQ